MLRLLDPQLLPAWFRYPLALTALIADGQIDHRPWKLMQGESLSIRHAGLKERFPAWSLVPFARRFDTDDVACFAVSQQGHNPTVKIVHDFCSPGWADRGGFVDFEAWLLAAREEAREWDEEEAKDPDDQV